MRLQTLLVSNTALAKDQIREGNSKPIVMSFNISITEIMFSKSQIDKAEDFIRLVYTTDFHFNDCQIQLSFSILFS